jgi:hypothetical protein
MSQKIPRFATEKEHQWQNESEDTSFCQRNDKLEVGCCSDSRAKRPWPRSAFSELQGKDQHCATSYARLYAFYLKMATNETQNNEEAIRNEISPQDMKDLTHSFPSCSTKSNTKPNEDLTVRQLFGSGSSRVSDFINEHLIVVRFAASASIVLLTAYGISHTPMFFRYRTVTQLPSKYFSNRIKLRCRIIKADKDPSTRSIILHLRHLSQLERLCFSKSWFDWMVRMHPTSILRKSPDQDHSQLLKVALAGIQRPPYDWEDGWFDQLVNDKTPITCQCLARGVLYTDINAKGSSWATSILSGSNERKKRPIPDVDRQMPKDITPVDQIAICKVSYRPMEASRLSLFRLFHSSDLAESMVISGRAVMNQDSLYGAGTTNYALVDRSESVKNLQRDATYFNHLSRLEYQAACGYRGIWSDASYRDSRQDIVEEADFQAAATLFQKIWRWIRGVYR